MQLKKNLWVEQKLTDRDVIITAILQYCAIDKLTAVGGKQLQKPYCVPVFFSFFKGLCSPCFTFQCMCIGCYAAPQDPTIHTQHLTYLVLAHWAPQSFT